MTKDEAIQIAMDTNAGLLRDLEAATACIAQQRQLIVTLSGQVNGLVAKLDALTGRKDHLA